ncbi:hypothetical protein FBU30_004160 [Linnemannia zychae]|nr:hypothetical protein FBU30_004160 [Linnemannia zychae]
MLQYSTQPNKLKLFFALLAFLTYKYRSHAIGTRRRPDLKEPKGTVPFFGHMFLMASIPDSDLYDHFVKNYRDLGPVWSISLPGIGRMIQGDSPDIIEHVLKTNFWAYNKGSHFNEALHDLFGGGIINSDGESWKFQRKQAAYLFKVEAFREYTSEIFNLEAQKVLEYLGQAADSGSVIDFQRVLFAYTLDVFGSVLFGEKFGCLDDIDREVPLGYAISGLLGICSQRIVDPLWKIREAVTGIRKQAKDFKSDMQGRNKKDMLQMLLETTDDNGKPLTESYLIDILVTFTIAGRDAMALSLSWMMYALLRDGTDPTIMQNLVKEVDEVLEGGLPTYETHKRQKYAEACYYETLRLFPSVPRNIKACIEDDVLPGGTKIYAGELFTWSSYVTGRSERLWGPDVEEFKPERWMGSEKAASMSKFSSFHLGPRVCVGKGFAILEALTMAGLILQQFELKLAEPGKLPVYGPGMTLIMRDGLPVHVTRRPHKKEQ